MKKLSKLVSLMLSAVLCLSMAAPAFAITYHMEDGDVYVENDETKGVYSYQGEKDASKITYMSNDETNEIVITQNDSSKATKNTIAVGKGVEATITLKDVNIDVSRDEKAALSITGTGKKNDVTHVTIDLEGENTLKGGDAHAGLELNKRASVTIKSDDCGSLTAEGGLTAAGIGGSGYENNYAGNITIKGNAEVNATSSADGAGIGSGLDGKAGNITIEENAKVTANGGEGGAGIGSDCNGTVGNIIISGNAQVTANSGKGVDSVDGSVYSGAGIGTGYASGSTAGSITIMGSAQVNASSGDESAQAIGKGSYGKVGSVDVRAHIIDKDTGEKTGSVLYIYQPKGEERKEYSITLPTDGDVTINDGEDRTADIDDIPVGSTVTSKDGQSITINAENNYPYGAFIDKDGNLQPKEKPAEPENPENPENPDNPDNPVDPVDPVDPVVPDTPVIPNSSASVDVTPAAATIEDQEVPLAGLMSRQILVSALYVHEGSPDGEDAEGEYVKALAWAVANGIIGEEADPEETVTVAILRDAMARYARLLDTTFDVEVEGEDDELVMNCGEILAKFFKTLEQKAA